jgi:hypothetical protein
MASQNSISPNHATFHTFRRKYRIIRMDVRIAGLSSFQYPTTVVKIVISKHARAAWKNASGYGIVVAR